MAAPEIRLSVGLDLEFFRGQMRKAVNIAQSEFTAQLAVKIDRNKLNTELNNLQKAIKRRTYRIEIGGNLEKAPDKIASLKKALSDLEGTKIDLGIGGITSIGRDEARKIRTALRRSILENGGKILVPTSIVAAITEDDVAAFQVIVKRKLSGIKVSLSIVAGINSEDIATFKEATQAKLSGIKVPVSILPKILTEDITAFKEAVKNKLSGIKVKVGVEAQVPGAGAGAATVPGEKKRPAGYEAALQSIGNLQVEQLRKRAFSSLGEESRTAQQVSTWLNTIVDQGLKGKAKASQLTAVREFLAEGLATAAGKNIEARMQPIQGRDPNRRGAFPYVAKTGPIESKVLFAEAIALAAKIDAQLAEQARLLQEQTRRQAQYLARQNELLRNAATRFLPSAKEQIGGRSAQSQVVGNFYDRIRKTEKVFAQNFSANSYLPKASMMLASSMDGAATQLKALPATRIAGALPSSEMRLAPRRELYRDVLSRGSIPTANARPWQKPSAAGPMALPPARIAGLLEPADVQNQRKFKKAIEVAATVDAVNAAKHREQLKVNAENQVRAREAAKRDLRNMFTGLPPIQAPSIGQEKAPLSRAATRSLNKARQLLGMSIGPTSPYAANPWAGTATVPPVTPTAPSNGLPPAGATSNYGAAARRQAMAQAFQQYGFRQAPSIPPPMAQAPAAGASPPGGPPTPPGGGGAGVGGGGAGAGGAGRRGGGIGGLNIPNLPGAGLVQELGTEFAFAAKQVLLFGTAYKALAFLTGFPQQVGDAVAALQIFRNTLNTISPSAGEAAKSSQFILDIVDKYNVPLQSARDGFTKLYASMQPAGFSGNEIRDLFLGISQSAASFGMSADKVDRVNYAFAQMASKGQVMSEELKGQLGDVLPGAMAIFAEAAGFKGPEAIKTFSKALEDGAYKGGAMKALLLNVGTIMRKEFGPGAEGAARTFQGSMNRMQNSLKFLYESFEPVAIGFLNSVVMPMTAGLKTVTEGFNAFFAGAATKTSGGFAIAQELEKLRPTFDGLRSNMSELIKFFGALASAALNVGKVFLQIAGNPIAAYLIKIYAIIVPLNMGLRAMAALWAANSLQLLIFNARLLLGGTVLSSFRGMMAATGATATATAASIRAGFASTGIGLILVGVGLLIERFMAMNQALADTKAKALEAASAVRAMSSTEARQEEFRRGKTVSLLQQLNQKPANASQGSGRSREDLITLNSQDAKTLEDAGIPVKKDVLGQRSIEKTMIPAYVQQQQELKAKSSYQQRQLGFQEQQSQSEGGLVPIESAAGGDTKGDAATAKIKEKEKYVSEVAKLLQQELQQKINKINQDASLSDRERAIQEAAIRYSYEMLMNKTEYNVGVNDENKKDILNRGQYLADLKKTFDNENELSRQRYEDVVTSPLRDILDDDRKAVIELEATMGILTAGRSELTNVESRQIQVKQALVGLEEDQIKVLQPLIDLILQTAAARDKLTEAEKRNRAVRSRMDELGDQLNLATIIDPRKERREQIKQENPLFTAGQIEDQAALEEKITSVTKARDQLREIASSIGNAFGDAFSKVITGAATAQQALAGMFQGIADSFAQMVQEMIAQWLKTQILEGFGKLFNLVAPLAGAAGGFSSGAAGFGGGFDSGIAALPGIPDFSGAFKTAANGAVWTGGFQAFADGGIVKGPTLGLVGEGRYNEAVVPLPDGKSIPVDLSGMGGGAGAISTNIVINVNNGQAQSNTSGGASDLGRKMEGAVKQVLANELRPGGLLSGGRR